MRPVLVLSFLLAGCSERSEPAEEGAPQLSAARILQLLRCDTSPEVEAQRALIEGALSSLIELLLDRETYRDEGLTGRQLDRVRSYFELNVARSRLAMVRAGPHLPKEQLERYEYLRQWLHARVADALEPYREGYRRMAEEGFESEFCAYVYRRWGPDSDRLGPSYLPGPK